jgi:pimeloyl-ACP methyl ester carboxylesterase
VLLGVLEGFTDLSFMAFDRIDLPALVVLPQIRKIGRAREPYVRRVVPRAEFQYIADVGHFIMMEKPGELNALILDFVSRQKIALSRSAKRP